MDGGLVNPVPVSVCRALGADIVIAVNLNGDIVGKHFEKSLMVETEKKEELRYVFTLVFAKRCVMNLLSIMKSTL